MLRTGNAAFVPWAQTLPVLAQCAGVGALSAGAERLLEQALDQEAETAVAQAAEYPEIPADNGIAQPWAIFCGDADWPEDPATYQRDVRLFDRLPLPAPRAVGGEHLAVRVLALRPAGPGRRRHPGRRQRAGRAEPARPGHPV